MVRVISAHHFKSQDVSTCAEPCCSATAGDLLLLASSLHQVEVRDLAAGAGGRQAPHHTFPTVDLVTRMVASRVGRYLATLETRTAGDQELTFVRIYLNWWSPEAASQPMRARIAGRVTPASSQEDAVHLEMIELGLRDLVTDIDVCPSTGNLIVASGCSLLIFKYTLVNNAQNKSKFVDFQECFNVRLSYCPASVRMVEDTIACQDQFQVHVFKIKMLDAGDEKQMRSLSTYSFSSESDSSMDPFVEKSTSSVPGQGPSITNITARRRTDSSSERDLGQGHGGHGVRRHPRHLALGARTSSSSQEDEAEDSGGVEVIPVPLVERTERELGCISTPRILEQQLGPGPAPPHLSVAVSCVGAGEGVAAAPVTLLYAKIIEEERQHDALKLLQLTPVYWREFRIRRGDKEDKEAAGGGAPHNPLQSLMFSHLMSLSLMFTSVHEGYLYHLPGHIRRPGKGVGVLKVATYPFTSPVLDLVLEPSLLHALTETGLETYTLKSGYHTVREAEVVDDKYNACPPTSTPLCLIGLRPFIGVRALLLATSRLVLVSEPASSQEPDLWTVYSLHLPGHLDLYRDMLAVADMNKEAAPHGFLQLVCEAHVTVRTALHRLAWLQVMAPPGLGVSVTAEDVAEVTAAFRESCLKLAEHYITSRRSSEYKLAAPYFRMSKLPLIEVLSRLNMDPPVPPGTLKLIEELVVDTTGSDNIMDAEVADRIIDFLGERSLDNLVRLVIMSPSLRSFKTKKSLDYIEGDLRKMSEDLTVKAEYAVAAVLVGGTGDWLSMAAPVELSSVLLRHHRLLLDTNTFSELAIAVRDSAPVIFVEVCCSLLESRLVSLAAMLAMYLQTFMTVVTSPTQAADNAGVFQLFLETYFLELLATNSAASIRLEADQQQALLTLVRSYLAGLLHPIPGPAMDDSVLSCGPEDMFGPRAEYLDQLPPFSCGEADPGSRLQEATLLKLQSLLCSPLAGEGCRDTVRSYLDQNPAPATSCHASLRLLSQEAGRDTVLLVAAQCPRAMSHYCRHLGREQPDTWALALAALLQPPADPDTAVDKRAVELLLAEMARTFPPAQLEQLLPSGPEYAAHLAECRRLHQADKLREMIVATGHTLLETLAL